MLFLAEPNTLGGFFECASGFAEAKADVCDYLPSFCVKLSTSISLSSEACLLKSQGSPDYVLATTGLK